MVKAASYPLDTVTNLSPQTYNKLNRLDSQERRIYLQELLGKYEQRRNDIEKAARRIRIEWVTNQRAFFDQILAELKLMWMVETGQEWKSIEL